MYVLKIKLQLFGLFCALVIPILFSFTPTGPSYESSPVFINKQALELNNAVTALDKAATAFAAGKISQDSLKASVSNARISYKKIEFFLAFHYSEYINEHINGAPLLHIEKSGTMPLVMQPEGMQVLDELAYSDTAAEEKALIAALSKKLATNYGTLYNSLKTKNANREGAVAAMRLQLVRILTLGLTGFDTPGSLNAIAEAEASLLGMREFLDANYPETETKAALALFDGAAARLKSESSFETLDRLDIIKKIHRPAVQAVRTS